MANANVETVNLWADRFKVILAMAAVVAGIAGFYVLSDYALVFKVLSVLAGLLVGVGIGWLSEPGKRFYAFTKESVRETRRVVWPSYKETVQTTAVVFGFVFLMALFLWLTDKMLEVALYDWILGWRK
jgi:preprotein translocase subunit SecE